jgi:hypothetical protein
VTKINVYSLISVVAWALLGVGHQGVQLARWEGLAGGAWCAVVGAPQLGLEVAVYLPVLQELVHVHIHAVPASGRVELEDALAHALCEGGLHLSQGSDRAVTHVGRFRKDFRVRGALHVSQIEDGLQDLVHGQVAQLLCECGHGLGGGAPPAPLTHGHRGKKERLVGHCAAVF